MAASVEGRPAGAVVRVSALAAALLLPVGGFLVLLARPELDRAFGSGTSHFYIVSVVSVLALVLACAVLWASRTVPAARTLFLALGFLAMAVIFLAHGLGTSPLFRGSHLDGTAPATSAPDGHTTNHQSSYADSYGTTATTGETVTAEPPDATVIARLRVVGYSAQLSLLAGSLLFALSVLDLPERLAMWVARYRWAIAAAFMALLLAHMVTALWFPTHLSWLPMGQDGIAWSLGGLASLAFGFAGWRFFQAYRLALLPIQGALAVAMLTLVQAQWYMLFGRLWQLSWWEYHAAMLAGFMVGVAGLLHHYRITGDLGAIVEGLFLRQQVTGIHAGDPRSMMALAAAVAAKDSETSGHIERVAELSAGIGDRLWLPEDRLVVLRWAGRLHDVGKIGVPNAILRKPGKLTSAEYDVIKTHAPRGWEIANRSGLLREAAPIIRAHHERLDGTGYPDGLAGDQIPFEARIVGVADVWDALTSDRPYRAAMSVPEAAEILLEESGAHLDPRCVRALFEILGLQPYLRLLDIERQDIAA